MDVGRAHCFSPSVGAVALLGAAPRLVIVVGLIWGIAVVADSAQFSASVIELSDPESGVSRP